MFGPVMLSSFSMRSKLLLIILIIFLPSVGIIIASGIERRAHEIEDARHDTLVLAESLAAQQEQMVTGAKEMLSTLARMPEVYSLDAKACTSLFRELHGQNPFYSVILAATPDGECFCLLTTGRSWQH